MLLGWPGLGTFILALRSPGKTDHETCLLQVVIGLFDKHPLNQRMCPNLSLSQSLQYTIYGNSYNHLANDMSEPARQPYTVCGQTDESEGLTPRGCAPTRLFVEILLICACKVC